MPGEDDRSRDFLMELYRQSDGDPGAGVSMYEVGAALGLDKSAAGALAEDIMVDGLAELRTLAGAISITAAGLAAIDADAGPVRVTPAGLGDDPVLGPEPRREVEALVADIRGAVTGQAAAFELIEELVIDLKTLDIQLCSPRPKTAVVREVLRSLGEGVAALGDERVSGRVAALLGA